MASFVSINILPDEYEAFVRAIPNELRLPPSYSDFVKRRLEEVASAEAQGKIVYEVTLHYQTFANHRRDTGHNPTYAHLLSLAMSIAIANPKR